MRRVVAITFTSVLLLGSACSSSSPSSNGSQTPAPSTNTAVAVTMKDFAITIAQPSAPAGLFDFNVTNSGPSPHELVIFRSDLAPDKLPLKNGNVDENGTGVTHITEKEDITTAAPATLTAGLTEGTYVFVCNLPGHYGLGMRAGFEVKAPTSSVPVSATMKDFAISLDRASAPGGSIAFSLTNTGPQTHEFVIFKSDLAADLLPVQGTAVNEEGDGVTHITEQEGVTVGTPVTLDAVLEPGKYVFICNLAGHYQSGMRVSFTAT